MHLPWYLPAIAAAVVWGLHYPLIEHTLRRVSFPPWCCSPRCPWRWWRWLFRRGSRPTGARSAALPAGERWLIGMIALTSLAGTVLLYLAVRGRNATLASLIEIVSAG